MTSCRGFQPRLRAMVDEDCVLEERPAIVEHLEHCASCRALLHTYQTTRRLAAEIAERMPLPAGLEERVREAVLAPPPAPEPEAEVAAPAAPAVAASRPPTTERVPRPPRGDRPAVEQPAPELDATVRSDTEPQQRPRHDEGRGRSQRPGRSRRGGRRRRQGRPGPPAGPAPQS